MKQKTLQKMINQEMAFMVALERRLLEANFPQAAKKVQEAYRLLPWENSFKEKGK